MQKGVHVGAYNALEACLEPSVQGCKAKILKIISSAKILTKNWFLRKYT